MRGPGKRSGRKQPSSKSSIEEKKIPRFAVCHNDADLVSVGKSGNPTSLANLLSDESEFSSDGAAKVAAAKTILTEKEKIAHFFAALGTSGKSNSRKRSWPSRRT